MVVSGSAAAVVSGSAVVVSGSAAAVVSGSAVVVSGSAAAVVSGSAAVVSGSAAVVSGSKPTTPDGSSAPVSVTGESMGSAVSGVDMPSVSGETAKGSATPSAPVSPVGVMVDPSPASGEIAVGSTTPPGSVSLVGSVADPLSVPGTSAPGSMTTTSGSPAPTADVAVPPPASGETPADSTTTTSVSPAPVPTAVASVGSLLPVGSRMASKISSTTDSDPVEVEASVGFAAAFKVPSGTTTTTSSMVLSGITQPLFSGHPAGFCAAAGAAGGTTDFVSAPAGAGDGAAGLGRKVITV